MGGGGVNVYIGMSQSILNFFLVLSRFEPRYCTGRVVCIFLQGAPLFRAFKPVLLYKR